MPRIGCTLMAIALLLPATALVIQGESPAQDPGPRGAPVNAGSPFQNLSGDELTFFNDGAARFVSPEGVANGLGPTFNGNSCGMCHSQPNVGGTSPNTDAYPNIGPNPQVALAKLNGANNVVPFFVKPDGPVREARFKYVVQADGTVDRDQPDGGVHDLFTIAGRGDAAPGCVYPQEDFTKAANQHNLSLRIPTPVFGAGLIEAITDATILTNRTANVAAKRVLGIRGKPNRNGNDGTITRFGWKAQNKSLLLFASEAYSVELGESNMLFPDKRGFGGNPPPASCVSVALPSDQTNYSQTAPVAVPSDDDQFATFMRFLDQPQPSCTGKACSDSIRNGAHLFKDVAQCSLCHTPSLTTGNSAFGPALSNVQANLFSDLLLHHMGSGLRDDISQGNAGPDEFRTAPLWGLGQRVYFLHDGRTSDLLQAIQQHASPGSEANGVISLFNVLNQQQKQDLLNFLRSL